MESEWPEDYLVFHIVQATQEGSDKRLSQFGRMWVHWMTIQWNQHMDHLRRRIPGSRAGSLAQAGTMKIMDMGPYPVCQVGLITSKRDWDRQADWFGLDCEWPDDEAKTMFFNGPLKRCQVPMIVVTLNQPQRMDRRLAIGYCVHEAVHVWQFICEHISAGPKVSREIEAYSVQWISGWLIKGATAMNPQLYMLIVFILVMFSLLLLGWGVFITGDLATCLLGLCVGGMGLAFASFVGPFLRGG